MEKGVPKSAGHVLGASSGVAGAGAGAAAAARAAPLALANSNHNPPVAAATEYEVSFTEPTLGLQFSHPPGTLTSDSRPLIVHGLVAGSQSEQLGVRPGDVVLCVEGNAVPSYDAFAMLVMALERPLAVRLRRSLPSPPSPGASASSAGAGAAAASVFNLSDTDREARRRAMQAAADSRAGAWDKKVKATARAREARDKRAAGSALGAAAGGIFAHPEAAAVGDSNPATQLAARRAQQQEARVSQEMGYNPFTPHLSSGGGAGSASASASPAGSSTSSAASSPRAAPASAGAAANTAGAGPGAGAGTGASAGIEEPSEEEREEVDLALGLLLSSSAEGGGAEEAVALCVSTIAKLVGNLTTSGGKDKFRRVKRANAAMQTRVLGVPGGEALLLAAGFVDTVGGEAEGEGEVSVLRHPYDAKAESLARYTLSRLLALEA